MCVPGLEIRHVSFDAVLPLLPALLVRSRGVMGDPRLLMPLMLLLLLMPLLLLLLLLLQL
jgi:hypothetical protein